MTQTAETRETTTPALRVETTRVDDIRQLIPLLEPHTPLVWMRKGFGLAGLGEALRLEFHGPSRITDAARTWREVVAAATVTDPVQQPGSGLLAFGTFAFSSASAATSVLIVPRVIIARSAGGCWVTTIETGAIHPGAVHPGAELPTPPVVSTAFGAEYEVSLTPGALGPEGYEDIVAQAIGRIAAGELEKVVLARDLVGQLPAQADLRRTLSNLALGYPDCWTFAVDGLIGSSPETLVRVDRGTVSARVLAGTMSRGIDAQSDSDAAAALATSTKDLDEHQFAVQSVLSALRAHSPRLVTSELPFTLKLPNLWHLATDVEGLLSDGATSLDLMSALHPTAAVAGSPTPTAVSVIDELEPFDRGRYAGPVGWVGADGDGEWAIALRCAQVTPDGEILAHAGCGVVGESDPAHELAETRMKFRPIVEAFG